MNHIGRLKQTKRAWESSKLRVTSQNTRKPKTVTMFEAL